MDLINFHIMPHIYELVIHPDDVEITQSAHESEISADNVKKVMRNFKRSAFAFLSNRDYVYGILRQLQMRVENEFIQMAVFRNEETALKWLLEMKSSQKGV